MALKAVSLLLAMILWITIVGFKQEEKSFVIAFEPQLTPGLVVVSRVPRQIQFRFLGPRLGLKRLKAQLPEVLRPDWKHYPSDVRNDISLNEELLGRLPEGVRVLGTYPTKTELRLEAMVTKLLPVKPVLSGSPPSGFAVKRIVVFPKTVKVSGPRSVMGQLSALETQAVDISELSKTQTVDTGLDLGPTLGLLGVPGDQATTVQLKIEIGRK